MRQNAEKLERVEEELRDTQKKMMQTENDLDKAQEDLANANAQLEEKEKKVQEVPSLAKWRVGLCRLEVWMLSSLALLSQRKWYQGEGIYNMNLF